MVSLHAEWTLGAGDDMNEPEGERIALFAAGGRLLRAIVILLSLMVASGPASALKFAPVTTPDGRPVLLVYDCGLFKADGHCLEHQKGFSGADRNYPGDAAVLDGALRERAYSEVWLYSGGGNLAEGVKVGEVMRRHRTFVVVPDGSRCISACTVAFLGGVLRDVQQKGTYEVHAYSAQGGLEYKEHLKFTHQDGEFALDKFVASASGTGQGWAKRLFLYVQQMIGGAPNERLVDGVLERAPDYLQTYRSRGTSRQDLVRMRIEGIAATQEILMRIERESFESRLAFLKKHADELGARSRPAIKMLEIMFSSRMPGTATLDQVTLKENGYINVRR